MCSVAFFLLLSQYAFSDQGLSVSVRKELKLASSFPRNKDNAHADWINAQVLPLYSALNKQDKVVSVQSNAAISETLSRLRLVRMHMPGEGDCLFHTLSYGVQNLPWEEQARLLSGDTLLAALMPFGDSGQGGDANFIARRTAQRAAAVELLKGLDQNFLYEHGFGDQDDFKEQLKQIQHDREWDADLFDLVLELSLVEMRLRAVVINSRGETTLVPPLNPAQEADWNDVNNPAPIINMVLSHGHWDSTVSDTQHNLRSGDSAARVNAHGFVLFCVLALLLQRSKEAAQEGCQEKERLIERRWWRRR
jgi:hypothetical protein